MEENKNAEIKMNKNVSISEECKDLMLKMTEKDPSKRISFAEILEHSVRLLFINFEWIKKEYNLGYCEK
jgi:serine/threonine protein kinase